MIHLPFAGFPLSGTGVEGEESELFDEVDVDIDRLSLFELL